MYLWLWRRLPGPGPLKALQLVVLLAVFAWVCFEWIFPAVNDLLRPADNQVVGTSAQEGPDHIFRA